MIHRWILINMPYLVAVTAIDSHSLPDAARELHDEQVRLSDKKPLEAQSSLSTAPTDPRALVCNK